MYSTNHYSISVKIVGSKPSKSCKQSRFINIITLSQKEILKKPLEISYFFISYLLALQAYQELQKLSFLEYVLSVLTDLHEWQGSLTGEG